MQTLAYELAWQESQVKKGIATPGTGPQPHAGKAGLVGDEDAEEATTDTGTYTMQTTYRAHFTWPGQKQ